MENRRYNLTNKTAEGMKEKQRRTEIEDRIGERERERERERVCVFVY